MRKKRTRKKKGSLKISHLSLVIACYIVGKRTLSRFYNCCERQHFTVRHRSARYPKGADNIHSLARACHAPPTFSFLKRIMYITERPRCIWAYLKITNKIIYNDKNVLAVEFYNYLILMTLKSFYCSFKNKWPQTLNKSSFFFCMWGYFDNYIF
jgi:hypothetical protein